MQFSFSRTSAVRAIEPTASMRYRKTTVAAHTQSLPPIAHARLELIAEANLQLIAQSALDQSSLEQAGLESIANANLEPIAPSGLAQFASLNADSLPTLAQTELAQTKLAQIELAQTKLAQIELAQTKLAQIELAQTESLLVEPLEPLTVVKKSIDHLEEQGLLMVFDRHDQVAKRLTEDLTAAGVLQDNLAIEPAAPTLLQRSETTFDAESM